MRTGAAVINGFAGWRDFSRRATRAEFWQFFLFFLVASLCLGWLANEAVWWVGYATPRATAVLGILIVSLLLLYLPFLATLSRRLLDVGLPKVAAKGLSLFLFLITAVFVAFADQINETGLQFSVPMSHAIALLIASLPSKSTLLPKEVP